MDTLSDESGPKFIQFRFYLSVTRTTHTTAEIQLVGNVCLWLSVIILYICDYRNILRSTVQSLLTNVTEVKHSFSVSYGQFEIYIIIKTRL